jgi:hypothetical protein
MKVVPVLAQCRNFDSALFAHYDKIGAANAGGRIADASLQPIDFQLTGTDDLIETLEREGQQPLDPHDDAPIEQSDNSLVRLINKMILEAHKDGRLGHPHRELSGAREDPHPLPQGRPAAHLPRAAAELSQRDDRAHQDHVRPRHQREAQAAGRQDQLREVLAAAPHRAARRDDPDQQRPRGRGDAHPRVSHDEVRAISNS